MRRLGLRIRLPSNDGQDSAPMSSNPVRFKLRVPCCGTFVSVGRCDGGEHQRWQVGRSDYCSYPNGYSSLAHEVLKRMDEYSVSQLAPCREVAQTTEKHTDRPEASGASAPFLCSGAHGGCPPLRGCNSAVSWTTCLFLCILRSSM